MFNVNITVLSKNFFLFLHVLLLVFLGRAQTAKVDSLLAVVKKTSNVEEKINTYSSLSWALIDIDLKKAIVYNDSAFNSAKEENYKKGIIDAYYNYSVLNRALGNYNRALEFLSDYEKLIEGDTTKMANAAFQRGVLNAIKGNPDVSIRSYQVALKNYELLNNERGMGITYNVIGIAYINMKRYDEAIKNFQKSIEKLTIINNTDGLASTYTNLASAYDNKKEYDKALKYYNKSIDFSEKTSNIRRIAHNKENISTIYKEQKNYPKAISFAQDAYKILMENNYHGELTGATANLGEIYALIGNYKKAEQILVEGLDSLKGSVNDQRRLYNSLSKLYEASNRDKKALKYYKLYKKLSDSIINKQGLKNLNRLQVKFDTEKKDKEIVEQQLAIEKQASELQKKKSQNKLITGIAISLLLTTLLIWFLYQQRQKRKDQEILTLKREQQVKTLELLMEGEEKERLRIAKELHDGVNVDLSSIKYKLTSLLEKNNDVINEAVAMIDKSCEQVRAISHDLVPPSLKDFSLTDALKDFCVTKNGLHKPEIVCSIIGDEIPISKKAEINIFRIVQELVNNSIKHAEASEIHIQISFQPKQIQITVEDNGKGFDRDKVMRSGIGLQNINSRVEYLNAKLDFTSDTKGTSYLIDINTDILV